MSDMIYIKKNTTQEQTTEKRRKSFLTSSSAQHKTRSQSSGYSAKFPSISHEPRYFLLQIQLTRADEE